MNPFSEQFKTECLMGDGINAEDFGPFYKGVLYQRGYGLTYSEPCPRHMYGLGLGDTLGNFFQIAWPVVKKGLQYMGKSAVSTAANIAQDAIKGREVKESAKEHLSKAAHEILAKAPATISGEMGIKRLPQSASPISYTQKRKRKASQPVISTSKKRKKQFGKGLTSTYPLLNQL